MINESIGNIYYIEIYVHRIFRVIQLRTSIKGRTYNKLGDSKISIHNHLNVDWRGIIELMSNTADVIAED